MAEKIFNTIIDMFVGCVDFASWLFSDISGLGISPIALFGITGFLVVFSLHVIHLVKVDIL